MVSHGPDIVRDHQDMVSHGPNMIKHHRGIVGCHRELCALSYTL